jgi:hypothetical protein
MTGQNLGYHPAFRAGICEERLKKKHLPLFMRPCGNNQVLPSLDGQQKY